MLKKIIGISLISSMLLVSSLNADNIKKDKKELILNNLEMNFQIDKKVIKDFEYIKDINGYALIFHSKIQNMEREGVILVFDNGNTILPYSPQYVQFIKKDGQLLNTNLKFQKMVKKTMDFNKNIKKEREKTNNQKIIKVFDKKKDSAIFFNSNKKESLLIFSDPHCPACNGDLDRIEEHLKKYNVYFVLTPLTSFDKNGNVVKERSTHPNSPIASAQILSHVNDKMSNEEKIKVLRKYFNQNGKLSNDKYDKKELQNIIKINRKYLESNLIDHTPTIIKYTPTK